MNFYHKFWNVEKISAYESQIKIHCFLVYYKISTLNCIHNECRHRNLFSGLKEVFFQFSELLNEKLEYKLVELLRILKMRKQEIMFVIDYRSF